MRVLIIEYPPLGRVSLGLALALISGALALMSFAKAHREMHQSCLKQCITSLVGICGLMSGLVISTVTFPRWVFLLAITLLLAVQVPIDLVTHQLWRVPTLTSATIVVVSYLVAWLLGNKELNESVAVLAAIAIMFTFWLLHRVTPSALGWGDVLLVIPLALAVAWNGIASLALWLLVACSTAALHASLVLWKWKKRLIPFGPHLLAAAWLLAVMNV